MESSPEGGMPRFGAPNGSPGTSMFDTGVSIEVGSSARIEGETHNGGNTSGGGLGCGAHEHRFSVPAGRDPGALGTSVWGPGNAKPMRFLASSAHKFPPPDWHPKGAGPSSN